MITSVQSNNKRLILIFQIFANLFYGLQYLSLGLLSASLMSCVSLVRCMIFHHYERKHNTTAPVSWLIVFSIISVIILFFTFSGVISVIPVVAAILYAYGIWQKNLRRFRKIVLLVSTSWIVYNFVGAAYASLIGSVFEFVSSLISIIRFDILNKQKNKVAKNQ